MRESWVPGERLPSGGVGMGGGVDWGPGDDDEGIVMEGKGELGVFLNRCLLLPPLEVASVGVATDDVGREVREEVRVRVEVAEDGRELVCREEVEVRVGGAADGEGELVCREVCREEVAVGAAEGGREEV